MTDFQIIISGEVFKLIPHGFCACGCGQKTKIARINRKPYGWIAGQPIKFIRGHHAKLTKGPNWHGGRQISNGYTRLLNPDYHRADVNGYVAEHILIVEKSLGKSIPPNSVVHHHTPEQLVVCQDQAYHLLLHQRKRAYEACGHADWRKCWVCRIYDHPDKMIRNSRQSMVHASCKNRYQNERRSMIKKPRPK